MNEKQKAKDLVEKFYRYAKGQTNEARLINAKFSASFCMDEKIEYAKTFGDVTDLDVQEFERIKTEIENYEP